MKKILTLFLILFLIGCTTEVIEVGPEDITTPTEPETPPTPDIDTTVNDTTDDTNDTIIINDTTTEDITIDDSIHTIEVRDDGFEPDELTIAVGDTVIFKNVRDEKFIQAFIIGAQGVCKGMTSKDTFPPKGFFDPGEEFSYTFEEAGECTYVDAILTTILGRITIE